MSKLNSLENRMDDGEMIFTVYCNDCKHLKEEAVSVKKFTCSAFLKGIPFSLASGQIRHDKRIAGDGGILFKARAGRSRIAEIKRKNYKR